MPRATPSDDPPPQPPARPDLDDCCHSGCTQCVFDLYDEALERYEVALAAWKKRQAQQARRADTQVAKSKPKSKPQADAHRSTPPRGKPSSRR